MEKLFDLPYFTLTMVMQMKGASAHNARVWLSRQNKANRIIRLTNGVYMSRDKYERYRDNPSFVGMVANIIQPHSYLSGEWVLQKYGVMTEAIFNVTCVTTKHTREIENTVGRFIYTNITDKLFEGYSEKVMDGVTLREASAAKALYDLLYLRKTPSRIKEDAYSLSEDLRLNLPHLDRSVKMEFEEWVNKYQSPKMKLISDNLRRSGWE